MVELPTAASETVPLKPLMPARLMLVELLDPEFRVKLCLAELIPKSTPATLRSVEAERPGAVPVTLTTAFPVRVPALTVRVAFCVPGAVNVKD